MANIPSFGSIKTRLGNLCMPSQIYLAISALALVFAAFNSFSIIVILVKIIFIGLWTFILNWICQKGYETISWILVIFPYVILFIMFLFGREDKKVGKSEDIDISNNTAQPPSMILAQTVQPPVSAQPPSTYSESDIFSKVNRQYLAY